jgi:hypothetical protein
LFGVLCDLVTATDQIPTYYERLGRVTDLELDKWLHVVLLVCSFVFLGLDDRMSEI